MSPYWSWASGGGGGANCESDVAVGVEKGWIRIGGQSMLLTLDRKGTHSFGLQRNRSQERATKCRPSYSIDRRSQSRGTCSLLRSSLLKLPLQFHVEGFGSALQSVATQASPDHEGDLLAADFLKGVVALYHPPLWGSRSVDRPEAVVRILGLVFFRLCLRLRFVHFPQIVGQLLPAVPDNPTDEAVVMLGGGVDRLLLVKVGAEDHESVARTRDVG